MAYIFPILFFFLAMYLSLVVGLKKVGFIKYYLTQFFILAIAFVPFAVLLYLARINNWEWVLYPAEASRWGFGFAAIIFINLNEKYLDLPKNKAVHSWRKQLLNLIISLLLLVVLVTVILFAILLVGAKIGILD